MWTGSWGANSAYWIEFLLGVMGTALEVEGGDGCTSMNSVPLNCTRQMVKTVNFCHVYVYHNENNK